MHIRAALCGEAADPMYWRWSFSQFGEDRIIEVLLRHIESGFYVDVGAHHPYLISNTYFLYRRGWAGINLDPNPNVVEAFKAERPRDTTLNIGIAEDEGSLTYYQYDAAEFNTFSNSQVESLKARFGKHPMRVTQQVVKRLEDVLSMHAPKDKVFGLLNVDTEGYDLSVLQSNDWIRFRPLVVAAEIGGGVALRDLHNQPIVQFLCEQHYEVVGWTHLTAVFRRLD